MIQADTYLALSHAERVHWMLHAANEDVDALWAALMPGDPEDTLNPAAWRDALLATQAIDPTRYESWRAFAAG